MLVNFIEDYINQGLGILRENEPLSKYTTFKVGGAAGALVSPDSKEALVQTMALIRKHGLSFKVIGKGSNLLPSDEAFDGVVVRLDKGMDYSSLEGEILTAGAGASTVVLANQMAKLGFSGLEFISGVPGTLGGAIYMNAGAYNREIKDILIKALILDEAGNFLWLTGEELQFAYRTSILQQNSCWVVVEAVLQLEAGDHEEISELMKSRRQRRMESQPLNMPSAGSTFRNPLPHASWYLIQEAGLRGLTVGGAQVSEKHCNFVVNIGNATASDILALIGEVQDAVRKKYGVELHPEVEMFNWN